MSDVVGYKKTWQVHSWDLQVGHGENARMHVLNYLNSFSTIVGYFASVTCQIIRN